MLNFKKGSIFDRSAKAQEDFMDEPGNQVLAVWGVREAVNPQWL